MFPVLTTKGEIFPLRADHNLYFLDAVSPNLPSEYASVEEKSRVMWHCRLGHINVRSIKKLEKEKGTGMVVNNTKFSVSHRDTCAVRSEKQAAEPSKSGACCTPIYPDL